MLKSPLNSVLKKWNFFDWILVDEFHFSEQETLPINNFFSSYLFFLIDIFLTNNKNETPQPKKFGVANANYYGRSHTLVVVVAS